MTKRTPSPPVTAAMAAHIKWMLANTNLFQQQIAMLLGINHGRITDVKQGRLHPNVPPLRGPFPV